MGHIVADSPICGLHYHVPSKAMPALHSSLGLHTQAIFTAHGIPGTGNFSSRSHIARLELSETFPPQSFFLPLCWHRDQTCFTIIVPPRLLLLLTLYSLPAVPQWEMGCMSNLCVCFLKDPADLPENRVPRFSNPIRSNR